MKKTIIFCIIAVLIYSTASAQTIFEDAKGESSIFLSNSPWAGLRINTSDESATLGFNKVKKTGYDVRTTGLLGNFRWLYGTEIKISSDDGIGSIVSKGKSAINYGINLNFGISGHRAYKTSSTTNDYLLYLKAGYSYDRYKLIDLSSSTLSKTNRYLPFLDLHFNKVWVNNINTTKQLYTFFGASLGVHRGNNIDDLDDGQINTLVAQSAPNSVSTVETGKIGSYLQHTYYPLKADLGFLPYLFDQNVLGFNGYARANFKTPGNPVNTGLGIFFADPKKVTSINGGAAVQFNNIFKAGTATKDKTSVFFYVGYTIK
jgi:hypothetical protein